MFIHSCSLSLAVRGPYEPIIWVFTCSRDRGQYTTFCWCGFSSLAKMALNHLSSLANTFTQLENSNVITGVLKPVLWSVYPR